MQKNGIAWIDISGACMKDLQCDTHLPWRVMPKCVLNKIFLSKDLAV
jgi:hypothetical protein